MYGDHGDVFECKARPSFRKFPKGGVQMSKYENRGDKTIFCVHKHTISRGSGGMLPGNFYISDSLRLLLVHPQVLILILRSNCTCT